MRQETSRRVRVIDSHTEGEPTRVVVEGLPSLRASTMRERVDELRLRHDGLRSGIVGEPRGHDAIVGAYLIGDSGVVFFNNAGYLGMCGHGTIGVVTTLAYLGRAEPGELELETPVGRVRARLHPDGRVTVRNVLSYRYRRQVEVEVPGVGEVVGDIAYGGNWFFLTEAGGLELSLGNLEALNAYSGAIRRALDDQGITGANGALIDHVEFFGPPQREGANSRNFVLCPGMAYDRSPCGTGLSAKLACLAAESKLAAGEVWRQESIIGSVFEGSFEFAEGGVLPAITGKAWITGDNTLIFDPDDPFCEGIAG